MCEIRHFRFYKSFIKTLFVTSWQLVELSFCPMCMKSIGFVNEIEFFKFSMKFNKHTLVGAHRLLLKSATKKAADVFYISSF